MASETATILVTDLVGSTQQRAELGEDRAEVARRAHDRVLVDAAERSGGTVVKGLGDGVLVRFPGAAEAVAAGVAMQQGIDALGRREQLALTIRVGLSAGDVTLEDGDCFGLPVIEAARLCDHAEGGEILAADVVTVLARGRGGHEIDDRGPVPLKGLDQAVVIHEIRWAPTRSVADLRAEAPYVGREGHRQALRELFDAAAVGSGGLCLIAGEPGIGKSRLVSEVCADLVDDTDALVLWGGCHDGDVGAYAPFVEAFTAWVRGRSISEVTDVLDRDAPVLGRIVPAVRTVLPDLPEPPELGGDEATARLHHAVVDVFGRLARSAPFVFVVDDLHWGDEATVGLLRAVVRGALGARILVIATYRDTDLDRRHPLAEALPLIRREAEPVRIALDGLSASSVQELLQRLAGHDVPGAFADLLASQSEGNPFFLREMLLHLVDEGALSFEGDTWVAAEAIETIIPEGVREVVGRRLSGLSDQAERLLGVGALFEVAFPLTVAAEVAGLDEDEALDAVDEALEAQIVRATEVFDHFAFSHALFRQTLVEELNPSRLVRQHRAVAEAYERSLAGEPTPAQAAVSARQWHLSSALPGSERGVPAALIVARDAAARYAHRETFEALGVVLDLLPDGDADEPEFLEQRIQAALNSSIERRLVLAEAGRLVDLIEDESGGSAVPDTVARLVDAAWTAGLAETAWALAAIGRPFVDSDRRDATWAIIRFMELNERDFDDPEQPGIPLGSADRIDLQSAIEENQLRLPGLPVFHSTRRSALEEIDREPDSFSTLFSYWSAGELRRAADHAKRWRGRRLDEDRIDQAALCLAMEARLRALLGEHGVADACLLQAEELLPRVAPTSNATFQVLGAGALVDFTRGIETPPSGLEALGAFADNPETKWAALAVVVADARSQAVLARPVESLASLERVVIGIDRALGFSPNYPMLVCLAAETLWTLRRTDHLDLIERNLRDKLIGPDIRYPECDARLAVARLCALDGRLDEARTWLSDSRTVLAESEASSLLVHADFMGAQMELRAGDDGDRDEFRACTERARTGAADPAMAAWITRLDDLESAAAAWL